MIEVPRRQAPARSQSVEVKSIPAPVGGLNARDAISEMPETDAIQLDNFFPSPSYVALRNGYSSWATGLPAAVPTVACYSPAGGARKLFAASNGSIYDVTTQGAVGAALVTGNTSDWWQFVNFGAGGGQYLVMVNGSDSMQIYNGTAWQQVTAVSAPIAITGATTANFIHVNEFGGRLFFIVKNSMQVYYLPALSVGGAATLLDLSTQTRLGGYLMAMAVWTLNNSAGMQQEACFITSEGEVLLYQGNDPGFASSWFQLGSFRIGHPIGRRCFTKIGSDVAIISIDGLVPLSKALLDDRSQQQDAISDKIHNLVNIDTQAYGSQLGWQPFLYPTGNKVIINVPATTGTYQYVMNTLNGSWCRFVGWAANTFEMVGDSLYFGGSQAVYLCDIGTTDNGAAINGVAIQAPSYFGSHLQKMFTMARPLLYSNALPIASVTMNLDFDRTPPVAAQTFGPAPVTQLPVAWPWQWSAPTKLWPRWYTVGGTGFSGSVAVAVYCTGATLQWQATDVGWIQGDPW